MDETPFIYGFKPAPDKEKVLVKMYVPKDLKTRLDTLKLVSGRKLQELAAEALDQYLTRELTHWSAKREAAITPV